MVATPVSAPVAEAHAGEPDWNQLQAAVNGEAVPAELVVGERSGPGICASSRCDAGAGCAAFAIRSPDQ